MSVRSARGTDLPSFHLATTTSVNGSGFNADILAWYPTTFGHTKFQHQLYHLRQEEEEKCVKMLFCAVGKAKAI